MTSTWSPPMRFTISPITEKVATTGAGFVASTAIGPAAIMVSKVIADLRKILRLVIKVLVQVWMCCLVVVCAKIPPTGPNESDIP